MVDVRIKQCGHNGCFKQSSYVTKGSTKAEFCSEHKRAGVVNVRSKRCAYHGCSKLPSFGTKGSSKTEFCSKHKRVGMVDVVSKRCANHGCSKFRLYGTEGSRKAEFCSVHKGAGMVNVKSKRCAYRECYKQPSYGTVGSRKAEFCNGHKRAGMMDVTSKRCANNGCSKFPLYGTEGSRKAEFCSEHKGAGMVDVKSKRCANHGCSKIPSYGTEGSRKKEFCNKHKTVGMVDVVSKRCAYHGCFKLPSYGTEGSKKKEFCSEHKRAGMVNVKRKRCASYSCSETPSFGTGGSKETEFCSEHNRAGMVDGLKKRCTSEGCVEYAVYGQDGSRRPSLLLSRRFTESHHAGASAVEAAKATQEAKEVEEGAGVQAALPNTRERPLRVERFPRQMNKTFENLECGPSSGKRMRVLEREKRDPSKKAQQVSAVVQKSSPNRSPTGCTPLAPQDSSDQSRGAYVCEADTKPFECGRCAAHNLRQVDGATSREPKRCTLSGCGRDDVRDLPIDSFVAPAKPAQLIPAQGIARTDTGEGEVTESTGITASVDRALARCGGCERDDAGNGDALITSRFAGAKRNVSTTSRLGLRRIRKSSASDLQDLRNIASLKKGKRRARVELGPQVVFDADIATEVEPISKGLGHRVKSVKGRPGTAVQSQTRGMVDTIAPAPVDVMVEEGDADDHMGLDELYYGGAGEGAVSPMAALDVFTVWIKPEG